MQLKKSPSIRLALATASCALLAPVIDHPVNAAEVDSWILNFGTLVYQEKNRVSIFEPIMIGTHNFNEEDYVSFRLVSDTMSGASPTGASVSSLRQTIPAHTSTSASGSASASGSNSVAPYALPQSEFADQRLAMGADWQNAYSRTFRSILGANFSNENDYSSFGASVTLQRDTADKLTTLTLGLSLTADTIQPGGGVPQGLTVLSATATGGGRENDDDDDGRERDDEDGAASGEKKLLTDALIGVTQVINRRWLTQINYSIGQSSGYLTDPYKMISRVNPTTGTTNEYYTENRPDNRLRQAIYWKNVLHLPNDVVHLSYRYYWDDWEIQSHTAEIKYHFNLADHFYLMPSYRYYQQTGAMFFKYSLLDGQALPTYASSDLRLAPMQSSTIGLKLGYNFSRNSEISVRAERMQQTGESEPDEAVGSQREVNLFPKLEVMMYTFEFSFAF